MSSNQTLRVTSFNKLPARLQAAIHALHRWAGLGEYEFPAITTSFEWRGGAAFSAVVGRGGRAATVILLDGWHEVIIGDNGLRPVLLREGLEPPEWEPTPEELAA